MTALMQTLAGVALFLIGSIKAWMHITAISVLISVSNGSFFERAHCWGCYVAVAGLILAATGLYDMWQQRRGIASLVD
jgi:L-lactate permease